MSKSLSISIKSAIFISYIAMIIFNVLANTLPLNNITTGEISAKYETLFTPAGLTFSIWGLIYILLAMFTVRVVFYHHEQHKKQFIIIAILFVISSLMNMAWLWAWHYDYIFISWLFMIALLSTLIALVLTFNSIDQNPWHFENLTFGIYLGWISVATIANTAILLVRYNFSGFGISDATWTILVISVAVIIAVLYTWRMQSATFAAVLFWALLGIAIQHFSVYNAEYPSIIITIGISLILLTSLSLTKSYLSKTRFETE